MFWDADDRFDPDALRLMYEKAEETDADICICGADSMDNETGLRIPRRAFLYTSDIPEKQPFNHYDIPGTIFNFTSVVVWNKLFRRSFVEQHGLKFGSGDYAEETMITLPALYYAERISYVDRKLILYRVFNPESAVMNVSRRKTKYYKDVYQFYDFMKQTGEFDLLEVSVRNRLLDSCLSNLDGNMDPASFREEYSDLKDHVFSDFGLTEKDEAFFHRKENYQKMCFILTYEPEEYLLWQLRQGKRELLVRVAQQKAADRKKNDALKKELRELKQKNEAGKHSLSFRIGRAMTWFPRKLKKLLHSKK